MVSAQAEPASGLQRKCALGVIEAVGETETSPGYAGPMWIPQPVIAIGADTPDAESEA
jgi:hypothetical protein